MRLLYLSCHSVLEYDEVSLFTELGIDVFSPGAYLNPHDPGPYGLRPHISGLKYDPEEVAMYLKLCEGGGEGKERLSRELVDRFDVVMFMHMPEWIEKNWPNISHKRVVIRTIGQCVGWQEGLLANYRGHGLKIVRYSPRERHLVPYAGEDAMIRFYKDPEVYKGWTGEKKALVNFTQHMPGRKDACNYHFFLNATKDFPTEVYGPMNEAMGSMYKGCLSTEAQIDVLRKSRICVNFGTHPASYTLSIIEAGLTGTPLITLGTYFGNAPFVKRPAYPGADDTGCLYEVPHLYKTGVHGYFGDSVTEMRKFIQMLLDDDKKAAEISANLRHRSMELFGKDNIANDWRNFFKTL